MKGIMLKIYLGLFLSLMVINLSGHTILRHVVQVITTDISDFSDENTGETDKVEKEEIKNFYLQNILAIAFYQPADNDKSNMQYPDSKPPMWYSIPATPPPNVSC